MSTPTIGTLCINYNDCNLCPATARMRQYLLLERPVAIPYIAAAGERSATYPRDLGYPSYIANENITCLSKNRNILQRREMIFKNPC